jgi:Tn3 transposase DDE domain
MSPETCWNLAILPCTENGHLAFFCSASQRFGLPATNLSLLEAISWLIIQSASVGATAHRLDRFRDREHKNQQTRAAALNLVTAAIFLSNCWYLDRFVDAPKLRDLADHQESLHLLLPLGWDHINLTGN